MVTTDQKPDGKAQLRDSVRRAYSAIARNPQGDAPFPTGRNLALDLGYPVGVLETLPSVAVDAFAGVSCVSIFADIPEGAVVLDVGCGAGLDSLIAARRVGPGGRVEGVDFSEEMLLRAESAVVEAGLTNVHLCRAAAESLPLEAASVDIALANGIFNLNPDRDCIFRELGRVVRPGGRVFAAELVLVEALSDDEKAGSQNWFT